MRFQSIAARSAFTALILGVLTGAGAAAAVRLGLISDKGGSTVMIPNATRNACAATTRQRCDFLRTTAMIP